MRDKKEHEKGKETLLAKYLIILMKDRRGTGGGSAGNTRLNKWKKKNDGPK